MRALALVAYPVVVGLVVAVFVLTLAACSSHPKRGTVGAKWVEPAHVESETYLVTTICVPTGDKYGSQICNPIYGTRNVDVATRWWVTLRGCSGDGVDCWEDPHKVDHGTYENAIVGQALDLEAAS